MVAPSSMTTPGADHHVGLDHHVLADARVMAEKHRLGRDQRRASGHRLGAQALLHRGFGLGEFGARVDAEHLFAVGLDHARLEPVAARKRHGIGEIEFALGVVVADPAEQAEQRLGAAEAHDAGIAERERALGRACVFLLANAGEPPALVEQQAAIARRVLRLEADDHEVRAAASSARTALSVSGRSSGVSP